MKRMLLPCLVSLVLFGCGSNRGDEPRSSPPLAVSENLPHPAASLEVPRPTFEAMQSCADRYAPKLRGESFAVMYDVEVTNSGNTVKVKDSMLDGNALERCLAGVLEQMDAPVTAHFEPNVSPHSRSMVGVVQAVVAPIAMGPIFLVAAGVTILVGVTIYVASEMTTEKERCKKVKAECIVECSIDTLHQRRSEPEFTRCMRVCLEKENCW